MTGPGTVQGFLGGSLSVTCTYQPGQEKKPKFWCTPGTVSTCGTDIVITSESQPEVQRGRFSIRDNRTHRAFTVTVERLSKRDAGTFRCGVRIASYRFDDSAIVNVIVVSGQSLHVSPMATVTTGLGGWGQTKGCGVTLNVGGGEGRGARPALPASIPPSHLQPRRSSRNNHTRLLFIVAVEGLTKQDVGTFW